jgi:LPXTG-site transpeptidase (sortase) family protein
MYLHKKIVRKYKAIAALIVVVLTLVFLTNAYVSFGQANLFSNIVPNQVADFSSRTIGQPLETITTPYNIYIPKIDLVNDVAMIPPKYWNNKDWQQLESIMQETMDVVGAVAYPHSVQPGNDGKIILTAHSSPPEIGEKQTEKNTLFEHLPELLPSDQIFLTVDGVMHEYQVVNSQIVSPNNAALLEQNYDSERLVLITCYPIGSTKDRLIVRAKKIREIVLK